MRELTIRGRCFLAAGVAAVVCGIQVGEHDFVQIGLLAIAVPVLAWLLIRRTERDVWVRRTVSATQVEAGEPAEVHLEVGADGQSAPACCCSRRSCPPRSGDPSASASSRWPRASSPRCAT